MELTEILCVVAAVAAVITAVLCVINLISSRKELNEAKKEISEMKADALEAVNGGIRNNNAVLQSSLMNYGSQVSKLSDRLDSRMESLRKAQDERLEGQSEIT